MRKDTFDGWNTKLRGVGAETVPRQDSVLGKAKGIYFLPVLRIKTSTEKRIRRKNEENTMYQKGSGYGNHQTVPE